MIVCKVDNSEHENLESLHNYLRKFHIKREKYYHEYFPRYDLLTKELIPFKDYDQYFNQDFINKINLKKYLKEFPVEGKEWAINWLKKRKISKSLKYAPSQAELKSLDGPSMNYYNNNGGYYNITKEIGFEHRYKDKDLKYKSISKELIIDTREQKEIKLDKQYKIEFAALKIGDYCLKDNKYNVFIERKSLNDFVGTLSVNNLERFVRELQRAVESDSYIIMMVENNINNALGFNYLPQMRWVKATPAFIFKNLRDLLTKYPNNFQVLFVDGRKEFSEKMIKIFSLGNEVKEIDLQYKYEKGEL